MIDPAMNTVWIYAKGTERERRFESEQAFEIWAAENDPEGVAFSYTPDELALEDAKHLPDHDR